MVLDLAETGWLEGVFKTENSFPKTKEIVFKTGPREFLAACGVRGTSCDTVAQDTVSHEVVGEGPRRIIFDLENISEHEKAAGAKSEGLTLGPCCDYNKGLGSFLNQMQSKNNTLSITVMY